MIVISTGCPSSIGPEVAVAAAARARSSRCVLVGDTNTLRRAAALVGVLPSRLVAFEGTQPGRGTIATMQAGPRLTRADNKPGKPSAVSGRAQLEYINAAFELVRATPGSALATAPVSKSVIASSGYPGAEGFLGHTEWLQALDGAKTSVMCFAAPKLVTSLATTHVPMVDVPRRVTARAVTEAAVRLVELLQALGKPRPHVAVCALNPHAGESELLGREEARAIVPGVEKARFRCGPDVTLSGPIGAETAFRKAYAGAYDGVVALYHDQATVPMKLVAFGEAVNVTMGLSIVRTSVDHGTGYDIAWKGIADARGMLAAIRLAERLARHGRSR